MAVFKEVWSSSFQSAIIATTASEAFGADEDTAVKKQRYGSANSLVLTSLADEDFSVRLDGLDARALGLLFTRGSVIIKPEDGIFFDSVKLTNESGTNSAADEVFIKIARAEKVSD